jgi:hypothetical protein
VAAADVAAADLNEDGRLDLVFANNPNQSDVPSASWYVYLGAEDRRAFDGPLAFEGRMNSVSIADLNRDDHLDLIMTDQHYATFRGPSYIYWGNGDPTDWDERAELETYGGRGVFVADLDADGAQDLLFANFPTGTYRWSSYLYWGDGFQAADMTELLTEGARGSRPDLGNIYDRRPIETYVSPVIELPASEGAARLSWRASTPLDTSIRFRLRSAPSAAELERAEWCGPTGSDDAYRRSGERVSDLHSGHRFIQYEATFDLGSHRALVTLHSVTVTY